MARNCNLSRGVTVVIMAASIGSVCRHPLQAFDEVRPAMAVVTAKLLRYAQRIVVQYDANHDGRLDTDEWRAMRGQPNLADLNRDGQITVEEFAQYVANYSAGRAFRLSTPGGGALAQSPANDTQIAASRAGAGGSADADSGPGTGSAPARRRDSKFFSSLPAGVPPWFVERDTDGDGQLTLSEFSPKLHKTDVDDFNRHDLNHDGILTAQEYLRAGSAADTKAAKSAAPTEPVHP